MERRGAQLAPITELDDLRELVDMSGDVLSVCLPFGPADEGLALEAGLEWWGLREQAARAGAPPDVLAEVDQAVDGAHRGNAGLHVVAGHGRPAHVEGLAQRPSGATMRWGPVPALVPLLADRQRRQPHVVVLVDRQGADVIASSGRDVTGDAAPHQTAAEAAPAETLTTVHGATYPLRKVAGGGWSQRRYQQHAEETWRHNMAEVAGEVVTQAERVGARLLAVGGDDRAVGLLLDHLPEALRPLVRPLAVTRAADGSATRLDAEVDRLLDDWLHQQLAHTVDAYHEELGQGDRAVAGPEGTLTALQASRVAVLLVATGVRPVGGPGDDEAARRPTSAWIGGAADDIAASPRTLASPGRARPVPLVDGAVAAALATGAEVRALADDAGADLPDGLGALLRW